MNLKSALVFALLLALAAIPAMAEDRQVVETAEDVTPVTQDVTYPAELDELSPELARVELFEGKTPTRTLTCEEIDGTPCTTSEQCGSCYPTPTCPLTPCYCGYGVCQCDI